MSKRSIYKRILIKLSGESLAGGSARTLDPAMLNAVAGELAELHATGTTIGIVVGGGNIFRGLSDEAARMNRVSADQMGMLATVINAIALRDALQHAEIKATVWSAIPMQRVAENFDQQRVRASLDAGEIAIFAGGTGNPFFTTDTAAALRAVEIGADALMKGTRVDGIYTADPE
jgi:uridylate kinase